MCLLSCSFELHNQLNLICFTSSLLVIWLETIPGSEVVLVYIVQYDFSTASFFRPRHDATRLVIEDLQVNHHSNSTDSTSIRGIFLGHSIGEISTDYSAFKWCDHCQRWGHRHLCSTLSGRIVYFSAILAEMTNARMTQLLTNSSGSRRLFDFDVCWKVSI